jgi:hypothetical protein
MGMIHHKDIEIDKTSHRSGAGKKGVSMKPPRSGVALADRGGGLPAVQGLSGLRGDDIHGIAAGGTWGTAQPLPYADTIQQAFGPSYDLSSIMAHVGGSMASAACSALGAAAYAMGEHVVFPSPPDLFTTTHEVAHVMQQRDGVQLAGGVGRRGDAYERNADAVASAVVHGHSVEGLLPSTDGGSSGTPSIQKSAVTSAVQLTEAFDYEIFKNAVLNEHNILRAKHGCPPLTLSEDLCTLANSVTQQWDTKDIARNIPYHLVPPDVGMVPFMGAGFDQGQFVQGSEELLAKACIEGRYATVPKDVWINRDNYGSLHGVPYSVMQMIWKSTKELGIGVAQSTGRNWSSDGLICLYRPGKILMGMISQNVPSPGGALGPPGQ